MKSLLFIVYSLLCTIALAGLPPTSSKDSSDSSPVTTFQFQFPNFTGTHTGSTFSLGVNSIAGGGTNSGNALNNNRVVISSGGTIGEFSPGTSGQVIQSNGNGVAPTWTTNISGNAANITGNLPTSQLSGTISNSQLNTVPAYTAKVNPTNATATISDGQTVMLGSPGFQDNGIGFQITGSSSNYFQGILQNTSSGSAASTDFIVNNNLGTSTTYYGDFGINSSGYTGSGSINLPNATYLFSNSGDLALGTYGANSVHVFVNSGSTDAIIVNGSNQVLFPGYTGYVYANGSAPLTASTSIPATSVSGVHTIAQGGTDTGNALANNRLIVSSGGTIGEMAAGSTANYLVIGQGVGVLPTYGKASLTASITGTLPVANGGTNSASALANNRLIVSSGGTLGEMAAGSTANYLVIGQGVGVLPTYGKASLTSSVTGLLPVANGGTNTGNALANNRIIVSSGGTIGEMFSGGTTGTVLTSQGNGVQPTWTSVLTNPMTTTGDMIYSSSGSTPARLGVTTGNSVLTISGGLPSWQLPPTGSYFSGYLPASTYWSTTSATFVAPTLQSGTSTLTTRRNINFGAVTASNSQGTGIQFTSASTIATYWVCVTWPWQPTGADVEDAELYDLGNSIQVTTAEQSPAAGSIGATTLCGPYTPGVSGLVTISLLLAVPSGTGPTYIHSQGFLSHSIEWQIFRMY